MVLRGKRFIATALCVTGAAGALAWSLVAVDAARASVPITWSKYNSGYSVYSPASPPASISARMVVPFAYNCGGGSAVRAVAFGVLLQNMFAFDNVVEPFVRLNCVAGRATYTAGLKMLGVVTMLPATITPRDALTFAATATPAGSTATFTDVTTGFTQSTSGAGITASQGSVLSFPRFGSTGELLGVPHFSPFAFSNAQVNGAGLDTYAPAGALFEYVRTTNGNAPNGSPRGLVQIQPGPIAAGSFSETWLRP